MATRDVSLLPNQLPWQTRTRREKDSHVRVAQSKVSPNMFIYSSSALTTPLPRSQFSVLTQQVIKLRFSTPKCRTRRKRTGIQTPSYHHLLRLGEIQYEESFQPEHNGEPNHTTS